MIRHFLPLALIAGLWLSLAGCNGARDTALQLGAASNGTGFVNKTLSTEKGSRKYVLFVPRDYYNKPNQRWPMIVFLHGIGEAGSDMKGPLRVGLAPFVADHADSFPFFVLFPQSTGGWSENSQDAADAIAAVQEVERTYAIDADRVSLTGLSTGGYGAFAIGAKYNQFFAALVPMCPASGASEHASILARMNIWAFENAVDPFVMPGSMAGTLSAIKSSGGNPRHTVYGSFGHDCWDQAYNEGEIFRWLEAQRRGLPVAPAPAAPSPKAAQASAQPAAPAAPASSSGGAVVPTPY